MAVGVFASILLVSIIQARGPALLWVVLFFPFSALTLSSDFGEGTLLVDHELAVAGFFQLVGGTTNQLIFLLSIALPDAVLLVVSIAVVELGARAHAWDRGQAVLVVLVLVGVGTRARIIDVIEFFGLHGLGQGHVFVEGFAFVEAYVALALLGLLLRVPSHIGVALFLVYRWLFLCL